MLLKQSKDYRNTMNNVEVRFALTGHAHSIENVVSIEQLKDQLFKQYKIELNDQKLIAKSGHIIVGNQKLENSGKFKKSFSSKVPDSMHLEKYNCIYLYNHRQLLLSSKQEVTESSCKIGAQQFLRNRLETGIGLRNNIFELKSVQENFICQQIDRIRQYSPIILDMIDKWHIFILDFTNHFQKFKEIDFCVGEYMNRFENQRKSANILFKGVYTLNEAKKSYWENMDANFQDLDSKLKKLKQNVKSQIQGNRQNIKIFQMQIKKFYQELDPSLKDYDAFRNNKKKQLEVMSKQLFKYYTELIDAVRQWLQKGNEKNILYYLEQKNILDKKFNQGSQECKEIALKLEDVFYALYLMYSSNQLTVKKSYKTYNQLLFVEQNKIDSLVEEIQRQLQNRNAKSSMSQFEKRQDKQIYRRHTFNNKLLAIQEEIRAFIKEQQNQRRMFVADILSNNQTLVNQCLENPNVPCFLLNYDQTTDQELPIEKGSRKKMTFVDNLQYYRPVVGIDKILSQLQIIKNCQVSLKKEEAVSYKIKNLKTILSKSADIFHFAYIHKLKQQDKKHENRTKMLNSRNTTLQRQINQLNSKNQEFHKKLYSAKQVNEQIQCEKKKLQEELRSIQRENENLLNNRDENCTSQAERLITNLQSKLKDATQHIQQLQMTNKQLENKVWDNLGLLEPVVSELQCQKKKVQQLNDLINEYKAVMGDQQVKITKLQQQMQAVKQVCQPQQPIDIQNKQEPIQDLNGCFYDKKMEDISILKLQIEQLENQKEQLKEENENINDQLMKIMMKDTEDIETQTQEAAYQQSHQYTLTSEDPPVQLTQTLSITFESNIEEGDIRVFMPFSNGVYVVVNPFEPNGIETNYVTTNQAINLNKSYVLDVNCLSAKARQLLIECNMIVIGKISKVLPSTDKFYVQAKILRVLGFQDDDSTIREYSKYL